MDTPTEPLPEAEDVLRFLGWPTTQTEQAAVHLDSVTAVVRAYTRGAGFAWDEFPQMRFVTEDLAAVIVSAAARSLNNPTHDRRIEVGQYNAAPGHFDGFSLAEQIVLHRYRRRTAGSATTRPVGPPGGLDGGDP